MLNKIQILLRQADHNKAERETFCEDISQRNENDPGLFDLIFFSDKSQFHLSGHINKQYMRFWAQAKPHELTHCPLSQEKMTMKKKMTIVRRWKQTVKLHLCGRSSFLEKKGSTTPLLRQIFGTP